RMVRFRTGMKVNAESWDVKPLEFSAELSHLTVETGRVKLEAPVVEVSVSPLYLLLGEVHLNDLRVESPRVTGTLPPDFFKPSDDDSFFKDFFKKDVPTEIGRIVKEGVDKVAERNLYLEKVSVVKARVDVGEIH